MPSSGQAVRHFDDLRRIFEKEHDPQLRKLYQIVQRACQLNAAKRFASAEHMRLELKRLRGGDKRSGEIRGAVAQAPAVSVALVRLANAQRDGQVAALLEQELNQLATEMIQERAKLTDAENALKACREGVVSPIGNAPVTSQLKA